MNPGTPDAPHQGLAPVMRGAPLESARLAVVAVHGRGASAGSILELADALALPDVAWLAPPARGGAWYPYSFLAPIEQNEPGITSGHRAIADALRMAADAGIPPERTALLGFSQGACLASEFAARNPRRYAAVVALSGGLIGPPGTPRDYPGSLEGTPVFLGCSDVDHHIPAARVQESADVLARMHADVRMELYPGMGHFVSDHELRVVRELLAAPKVA